MIATLLSGITASPWAQVAVRYGAIALAVLLFLLSIRRAGERTGRLVERLETMKNANDVQRRMLEARLAVLAIATIWLAGCATVGSDQSGFGACPPVVEYSREVQAKAAEEIAALPENGVIVGWFADYAVLRDQARACAG